MHVVAYLTQSNNNGPIRAYAAPLPAGRQVGTEISPALPALGTPPTTDKGEKKHRI